MGGAMQRKRMKRWQRLDSARVIPFWKWPFEPRSSGPKCRDECHGGHEHANDPRTRINSSRHKPREEPPIEDAREVGHGSAMQPTALSCREFPAIPACGQGVPAR